MEAQPEEVLNARVNSESGQWEVLIKWKGLPMTDYTWESAVKIAKHFPNLDLEGKVSFNGGGNYTYESRRPPILYQYYRKNKGRKGANMGLQHDWMMGDGS